ncbi:MAG: glycosyl hydrolase, repeat [Candidatus Acidoferrum typicum]|nr:glycosyl hydrolase, repeat [Candidatus Acidoferrum typicum]
MPGRAMKGRIMKRVPSVLKLAVAAGLCGGALFIGAEARSADQPNPTDKLKNLELREIGPAVMGGRIDDFAVVESNPNIVFAGAASGGVWKTTNNGTTWTPVFDKEAVSTIGDIAIAPSDPSVVWVGTGEPNNRQSSSWGDGAYKSLDGGKTWQNMGLAATRLIGRIVIHPRNPDVVYVAALGHLWGSNAERGVYKTTDGGKTWSQVLKINSDTGVSDIAMDPQSPDILYAAAYERRRTPYGFNGGGPDGGIYKTSDGGATWKKLTKGLPYETGGGDIGRIGLDIYRKDPNIVYAIVQHEKGGTYRSEDKGETWKKMGDTNPRPSYYSQIRIDPNNDLRIWELGAQMFYSEDGGKKFATDRVKGIHGDYHAMWIDPADSNHMIAGSDGGIHWSYDSGRSWDFVNTLAIGQFYEISVDNERPYHICGGLQDNGSWCGPSQSMTRDGITNEDWSVIHGGDGFYAAIDPVEPWTVYTESQDGNIDRRDLRTQQQRSISPEAKYGDAHYRYQWNAPVAVSVYNHTTIYYGGNYLFKSMDRGDTWMRLGGDLTTGADRNKLQIFGKTPDKTTLSRHDGVQEYPTITTFSESPLTPNVLWVGTDDGNLQVTRDGGKSWKNVASRVPGVPKGTYISRVVASKAGEGAALATFDGHRDDDYGIYIFATNDYGETWKAIRNGIPDSAGSVHVVREHPRNQNLLFAGLEFGLWVSWDRGANWTALKNNFPTVPVDDIQIQARENDLVLATHGRSIWIFDDITPLEKMDASVLNSDLTFFPPHGAITFNIRMRRWSGGQKFFTAKNPPYGAILNYYLKEALPPELPKTEAKDDKDKAASANPEKEEKGKGTIEEKSKSATEPKKEGKVKITVTDKDGKVVREFDGAGAAGVNRANWDLRYNPAAEPTPEQMEAISAGYGEGPRGPRVEPGKYTIKIKAGMKEATQEVVVEDDPHIQLSPEDRAARRAAIDQLYALEKTTAKDRKTIQGLKDALNAARGQWKADAGKPDVPKIPEDIQKSADELQKKVDKVAEKYIHEREGLGNAGPPFEWKPDPLPDQVQGLLQDLDGFAATPGGQQKEKLAELGPLVSDASAQLKKLIDEDLAALNKKMNDAGIPHIVPKPPEHRHDGVDGEEQDE